MAVTLLGWSPGCGGCKGEGGFAFDRLPYFTSPSYLPDLVTPTALQRQGLGVRQ